MKHYVEDEFIKEAYAAACPEWKDKIKAQFPDMFRSRLSRITDTEEYRLFRKYAEVTEIANEIQIPLPMANDQWSIHAWKLAMKIMEIYPHAYPIHKSDPRIIFMIVP